jgi:hypothetical protein
MPAKWINTWGQRSDRRTSPSHACGAGPSLSALKGGEGKFWVAGHESSLQAPVAFMQAS